jgi:hypothetical protein
MSNTHDHNIGHHDPSEGFDHSEPDSRSIFVYIGVSVVLLVAVIFALQSYFDQVWKQRVYDNVLSVPSSGIANQRNLEAWRMTHYEYTDKSKTTVRIPLDRAKAMFMEEMKAGKQFYPAKATEPKPEVLSTAAPVADGKQEEKGKEEKK